MDVGCRNRRGRALSRRPHMHERRLHAPRPRNGRLYVEARKLRQALRRWKLGTRMGKESQKSRRHPKGFCAQCAAPETERGRGCLTMIRQHL